MKCKICKKIIIGRADKIFCTVSCKNIYHKKLRAVTDVAVKNINIILHRNRSILLEILGKYRFQLKISRIILERKKFNFKYHTHYYINTKEKYYYHVYDLAWMEFSDDEILIVRKR